MAMDANGRFTRIEATYIVFGASSEEEALRGVRESAPAEWEVGSLIMAFDPTCDMSTTRRRRSASTAAAGRGT